MIALLLAQTSSLTLRLHQNQDVSLTDGALDVTDDGAAGVVEELDADLSDTSTRASPAEDLCETTVRTLCSMRDAGE